MESVFYGQYRQIANTHLQFGSIYSMVTAKADQRSWLLLPNNIGLYETELNAGTYELTVNRRVHDIAITQHQTTLLWLVDIGAFHQAYNIPLTKTTRG